MLIFVCACIATAKKEESEGFEWGCQHLDWLLLCIREVCGFFVSSIKLNFTLKKSQLVSVALVGAVVALRKQQVSSVSWPGDVSLHLDAVEMLEVQHQLTPAPSSKCHLRCPLSSVGSVSHRTCVWRAAKSVVQLLLKGFVRETSCHGHTE